MKPRRALLGNAAFRDIAGSEIVLLEIAEQLIAWGWTCDLTAWSIGGPMAALAKRAKVRLLTKPAEINPFAYDLVWLQNRLEPTLRLDGDPADDADRTLFVFAHLDQRWSLAQPGVVVEPALGEVFVVTAEHGRDHHVAAGLPAGDVAMMRNAAPPSFVGDARPPRLLPQRIAVVSNHPPDEVRAAIPILQAEGVAVEWIGKDGDRRGHRLAPGDIAGSDALVTIGKTVPYALLGRRPVYVYDHHGGPGWLTERTFDAAMRTNFNGTCSPRRLAPVALASELLDGFSVAQRHAAALTEEQLAPFRLETFLAGIVDRIDRARTPAEHRARLADVATLARAERALASAAGHYFGAWRRTRPD